MRYKEIEQFALFAAFTVPAFSFAFGGVGCSGGDNPPGPAGSGGISTGGSAGSFGGGSGGSSGETGGISGSDGGDGDSGTLCNGCITGVLGKGNDSIKLYSVTGLEDGKVDLVEVSGKFHLESAVTAYVILTCDGKTSWTDQDGGPSAEVTVPEGSFKVKTNFVSCAPDIVKVSLSDKSYGSSYVRCCFKKGTDF